MNRTSALLFALAAAIFASPAQGQPYCPWGMQAQLRAQILWQREQQAMQGMQMQMFQMEAMRQRVMAMQSLTLMRMQMQRMRQQPALLMAARNPMAMGLLARQAGLSAPPQLGMTGDWRRMQLLTATGQLNRVNYMKQMTALASLPPSSPQGLHRIGGWQQLLAEQRLINGIGRREVGLGFGITRCARFTAQLPGLLQASCRRCHDPQFTPQQANFLVRLPNAPVSWILRHQVGTGGPHPGEQGRWKIPVPQPRMPLPGRFQPAPEMGIVPIHPPGGGGGGGGHPGGGGGGPPRGRNPGGPGMLARAMPVPQAELGHLGQLLQLPPLMPLGLNPALPGIAQPFVPWQPPFALVPLARPRPMPLAPIAAKPPRKRPKPLAPIAGAQPAAPIPRRIVELPAVPMLHPVRDLPRILDPESTTTTEDPAADFGAAPSISPTLEGTIMQLVTEIGRGRTPSPTQANPQMRTSILPDEVRQTPPLPALEPKYPVQPLSPAAVVPAERGAKTPSLVELVLRTPPLPAPGQ